MKDQTLEVIKWAKSTSVENEVVCEFWHKLCEAVNEKPSASAEKIYSEIRLYGSSTALKPIRPNGVKYLEVAADVADKLAGWAFWQKSPYGYKTIENCEKFILEKMDISNENIEDLGKSVSSISKKKSIKNGLENGVKDYGITATTAAAAALIARQIGLQIAKQIVLRIATSLNVFLAALVLIDIAGPAYRCTIPGTVYIALLRKMYSAAQKGF